MGHIYIQRWPVILRTKLHEVIVTRLYRSIVYYRNIASHVNVILTKKLSLTNICCSKNNEDTSPQQ